MTNCHAAPYYFVFIRSDISDTGRFLTNSLPLNTPGRDNIPNITESDHSVASSRHLLRRSGASREQAANTWGRQARGGTESDHRVASTRHLLRRFGASREQAAHTRGHETRGGTESDHRVVSTRHLLMRSGASREHAAHTRGHQARGDCLYPCVASLHNRRHPPLTQRRI